MWLHSLWLHVLSIQLIATSDAIALIIIYLSKCCVVAIYLRLTPQKSHNRASWATLALCTIWVIPAIFVVLVNCELNTSERTYALQCPDLVSTAAEISDSSNISGAVHTMAIHRSSRCHHRGRPLFSRHCPPKGFIHVNPPQACRRFCIHLPFSVSIDQPSNPSFNSNSPRLFQA